MLSLRLFNFAFLVFGASMNIFSFSQLIFKAFLSIKLGEVLIFLAKTLENKESHFMVVFWTERGKFDQLSSRSDMRVVRISG